MQKFKRILVTGGGGYIGTHVVEQLLDKGCRVRIFDKFVFGKEILNSLLKNKNLEAVEGDISDLYQLSSALKEVDAVVHLAGLVGDPACAVDPQFTKHMNVVSTRIIKELSKSFGVKRFIFASSCSVYGASDQIVDETSSLNPVSLYAKTKIDSEKELLDDENKNFHPIILRFATVFGHSRRPRFDLVTNFFTAQAYNEGLITVAGSQQWRPFIHVADIARAIVMALEAPLKKADRQIFNVGDDKLNTTIGELGKLVEEIVKVNKKGKKVEVSINDNISDKRNYRVSFAKIKKVLGFEAKTTLETGIKEMTEHFKKGTYQKNYKDTRYINVEMTKLMQVEFKSDGYKRKNISALSLE